MLQTGRSVFVTGIGTGIGKTVVSAILARALDCDYWKPVQCGDLDKSDLNHVRELSGLPSARLHPERYRLKLPQSPHLAAEAEGVSITLEDFVLPSCNACVVEGAGGALVPLNEKDYIIDLASRFHLPVVLVLQNFLGSLNHTFLTIEALERRKISILGLVFNGVSRPELEDFCRLKSKLPILLRVPLLETVNENAIHPYVEELKRNLV